MNLSNFKSFVVRNNYAYLIFMCVSIFVLSFTLRVNSLAAVIISLVCTFILYLLNKYKFVDRICTMLPPSSLDETETETENENKQNNEINNEIDKTNIESKNAKNIETFNDEQMKEEDEIQIECDCAFELDNWLKSKHRVSYDYAPAMIEKSRFNNQLHQRYMHAHHHHLEPVNKVKKGKNRQPLYPHHALHHDIKNI